MKLLLDTSVWTEHLRNDALGELMPAIQSSYRLWLDGVVAGELMAGCRDRIERRFIARLIQPFARANRLCAASAADLRTAGEALCRLRERGLSLKGPGGALLDSTVAVNAVNLGALLVSSNEGDFTRLASVLPLRFETLADFTARLRESTSD